MVTWFQLQKIRAKRARKGGYPKAIKPAKRSRKKHSDDNDNSFIPTQKRTYE